MSKYLLIAIVFFVSACEGTKPGKVSKDTAASESIRSTIDHSNRNIGDRTSVINSTTKP